MKPLIGLFLAGIILAGCTTSSETAYKRGQRYDYGWDIAENDITAVYWYRIAAEQGHAGAQANLGFMYENGTGVTQDYAEALQWYRKAAEQGHGRAQVG